MGVSFIPRAAQSVNRVSNGVASFNSQLPSPNARPSTPRVICLSHGGFLRIGRYISTYTCHLHVYNKHLHSIYLTCTSCLPERTHELCAPTPPMAYMCAYLQPRVCGENIKKQSQSLPIVQWVVCTHCSFYVMQIAFQTEILHAQSSYTYRYGCCYSDTSSPRDYHYVLVLDLELVLQTCTCTTYLYY